VEFFKKSNQKQNSEVVFDIIVFNTSSMVKLKTCSFFISYMELPGLLSILLTSWCWGTSCCCFYSVLQSQVCITINFAL